ncbi:MAG: leucine-rich repeat domain-containing protein [Bacteroidales bacterium]
MNKTILIFLTIIFAINLNTQAEDFSAVCNGDIIYYNITSSTSPLTVEVTFKDIFPSSYLNEYTGEVSIPDSVLYNDNYYQVTSIAGFAFENCSGLTSITIPNSVTSIGIGAFLGCGGLTLLYIGERVNSIGDFAFGSCTSLNTVFFNSINCFLMGSYYYPVFQGCSSLSTLFIGDSVSIIPNYAFSGSSGLTSITIPNSVTSIGVSAFEGCSGLSSITIPSSVTSIGNSAFYGCNGLSSITMPNSVTSIGNSVFYECSGLSTILISESITSIGNSAFYGCNGLSSITIPNSVTSIGDGAFQGCNGLTSVTISNSITSIGNSVFYGCNRLTSITIPNSVTLIGNNAFRGCDSLTNISIGNLIDSKGDYAFYGCSRLSNFSFGDSLKKIGKCSFALCTSFDTITIPESVIYIDDDAFASCSSLRVVNFNAINCSKMGYQIHPVFNNCTSLDIVNIGNRVKSIPYNAFYGNASIDSVYIGDSVTTIVGNAFFGCSNLSYINITNSLVSIGAFAFYGCDGLISVIIPESVIYIGSSAFSNCLGLTSIILPNSIKVILKSVFSNSINLARITLGDSVTEIGDKAFYGCSSLDSIILPNTLTELGKFVFSNCSSLSSIVLPYNINKIIGPFEGCTNLSSITCKNNVPPVITGPNSFYNVPRNIPINIPCGSVAIYQSAQYWGSGSNPFTNFLPSSFCLFASDTNITLNSALLNATCSDTNLIEKGFLWRKLGDSIFNTFIDTSSLFQLNLTNLLPNTNYEYKAYCISNNEVFHSLIDTFKTELCVFANYVSLSSTTADVYATTICTNYNTKGFQYRELGDTLFINSYVNTSGFQDTLTGLIPFTKYEYRAFVEINNELSYSTIDTFLTLCTDTAYNLPFYEEFENDLSCWNSFKNSNYFYESVNQGQYPFCMPHQGSKMLKYNCWISPSGNYAGYISPQINIIQNSRLSFWIFRTNGQFSYENEGVRVLINSLQIEDSATEIGFVSNNRLATPSISTDGWYKYNIDIPSSQIGEKFIIIKAESQYGYNIFIDELSIIHLPPVYTNIDASICQGEAYNLNGFNVDSAGTYVQNLIATDERDSIITLNLSIYATIDTTFIDASICQGEAYNLNGFNVDSAGTYSKLRNNKWM